ncbi:MAG: peptide chain release factor N(5)-glutamine methyltransferase [Acidimicrobiales bacterium]
MTTWRELELQVRGRLGEAQEAVWLVQQAAGRTGGEWQADIDQPAPDRCLGFVEQMVRRREAGEPLQYVLGRWGFRHLDLAIDRRVLIPRPETEQVVEHAIAELTRLRLATGRPPRVVDLGTGSGAIALSIAVEVAAAEVWATDASDGTVAVARSNIAGTGGMAATRVRVATGSWYEALPPELAGRIDLVVSNPPYLAEAELADLDPAVAAWEPAEALVAGPTGLEAIEVVVGGAPRWLGRPGALVVELAPPQAEAAVALALESGFDRAEVRPDLSGRPRALVASVG